MLIIKASALETVEVVRVVLCRDIESQVVVREGFVIRNNNSLSDKHLPSVGPV